MTGQNHTPTDNHTTGDTQAEAGPAALLAALEARATLVHTPTGDGMMAWRIWGEGEPVVLGHGSGGAWGHWVRNIPELARTRRVIVPDLPGHGNSAKPAEETHEALSQALALGLEQILGAAQPVDLVGFSFGGVVFTQFAALYPQWARRLVIIGSGGLDTPLGAIDLRSPRGLEGEAQQAVFRSNLLGMMLHSPESVDDLALYIQAEGARLTRFRSAGPLVMPDRLIAALPQVRAPLDAIWGEFDRPHPHPAEQDEALRRFKPDMDFRVIADSGHWAMYERPEAFNAALADLLDAPVRAG